MNHKLISTLLAVCVTSLAIAAGIAAQDARSHAVTLVPVATAAAAPRFDASPYPAPQIDPDAPTPEPAPTF